MKLSTIGRYGLRVVFDMMMCSQDEFIPLKILAMRQKISVRYLERIMSILKKENILLSYKGPNGGYKINPLYYNITVGEVLRVLEGNINIVDIKDGENDLIRQCINKNVWENINNKINNYVDSIKIDKRGTLK